MWSLNLGEWYRLLFKLNGAIEYQWISNFNALTFPLGIVSDYNNNIWSVVGDAVVLDGI